MIVAILTSWRFLIKPIVLSSPTDNKTRDTKNGLPMPQALTAYNIPPHPEKMYIYVRTHAQRHI